MQDDNFDDDEINHIESHKFIKKKTERAKDKNSPMKIPDILKKKTTIKR